ncbi:MAG: TonB-dependent receptor [Chitinophagales bacterium]|nr:TonB-dependent receptor [Chitinophagales bacterium]
MKISHCIIILLLVLPIISKAQNSKQKDYTVKGYITDAENGDELIGVNVFVEGQKVKGTISDYNGFYSLSLNDSAVLVFKFLGYKDVVKMVNSDLEFNLKLEPEGIELNTVVVSASRKQEKILDAPSSISVINSEVISNKAGVSTLDYLKNVSGVHINKSGIQGGNPSVRGFNGYYSNDLMTLVDNRIASLPSLRLNAYSMIPTDNDDIARMEVLRGPASALYGPNTINGVVHIITKSPIDEQETKVTLSLGARSFIADTLISKNNPNPRFDNEELTSRAIYAISFRHADTIRTTRKRGVKMGYKISAKSFQGLDWKYSDPNEPINIVRYLPTADGPKYLNRDGSIDPKGKGQEVPNRRNEEIKKYSADARMDFRFKKDVDFVLSGGFNDYSGVDMTPIGAMQNKHWKYYYTQARVTWKRLFAQAYMNGNNAGDTYYVPTGGIYIDKSKFYGTQIQHSTEIKKRLNLIYGADAFFYRPNTEYTLHGNYEDQDNITEVGTYLQATYNLHPRVQFLAASRMDYGTQLEKLTISPRAAFIYKPGTGQNLRFVFNKAYRTAGPSAYFADVSQATIPVDIPVRAWGTPNSGFQYSFENNPYYGGQNLPQFRSPYSEDRNAYYNVGDPNFNNIGWQGILSAIKQQFVTQFPNMPDLPIIDEIIDKLIADLTPATIPSSVNQVVRDLNSTTKTFVESDWTNIRDIQGLKPMTAYNYEIGYKGIVAKMLSLSVDIYRTDFKNYVAPVTFVTPAVMFDSDALLNYVGPEISQRFNDKNNAIYKTLLTALLDKNSKFGGNSNGTGEDELLALFKTAVSNLPIGIITPKQSNGPEMLLVTRNIGDISLYGMDLGLTAFLSPDLNIQANYSFVNKDSIEVPGAQYGYVALNAPKHKVNAGVNYHIKKIGLNIGTRFQWMAGFPVNSGNFTGRVKPYHDIDLDLSWTPTFHDKLNITLSVQNLYKNEHQFFIGSPVIGSMAILRLGYRFL